MKEKWERAVQREENQIVVSIENPNDFNMTGPQIDFVDANSNILLADEALNAPFGIKYDEGPVER